MAIQLSEIPAAGVDLEHYVAALFQASAYYVEKNLIHRSPADILELDTVATDYSVIAPVSTIIEAKGGGWGWSDLFKVLGWMQYLGFSRAALFVIADNGKPLATIEEKLGPHGVKVVCMGDFSSPSDKFTAAGFCAPAADEGVLTLWRHSFDLEAKLTNTVLGLAKDGTTQSSVAVIGYLNLINNGTFFARDIVERITMLYEAYMAHPKLTLATCLELEGHPFDPNPPSTTSALLTEVLREGSQPLVQAAMYAEHRGRLALLKAAIDYVIEFPDGPPPMPPGTIDWNLLMHEMLPATFRAGMAWLKQQPTFHRYAVLWQQLLWGWGGFYLSHMADAEFTWMAEYSGIPAAEIPTALQAFDRLFPTGNSWFATPGPTNATIVRMVPMYFQGIGAHHRRQQYAWSGASAFDQVGGAQYTGSDLVRWNNAAYHFLTS